MTAIDLQTRGPSADSDSVIAFDVTADGFLYNMVRAIVGTLQEVGGGKHPPDHMQKVIQSLDRDAAGMTAAASGLYLFSVEYPPALLAPENEDSRS